MPTELSSLSKFSLIIWKPGQRLPEVIDLELKNLNAYTLHTWLFTVKNNHAMTENLGMKHLHNIAYCLLLKGSTMK